MRAALALGMRPAVAIRTIILPQALIRMLPPIGSVLVFAIKDSAIASVIAVPEIIRQSQVLSGLTYRSFEVYTLAMGVYSLLCYPLARGVDRLYRRLARSAIMNLRWDVLWQYRWQFLGGVEITVLLTVLTMALAVPFGLLLAFLVSAPCASCALQLPPSSKYFAPHLCCCRFTGPSTCSPPSPGSDSPPSLLHWSDSVSNVASFNSETFRAGNVSIRTGQRYAAFALGMRPHQIMRYIILSQAFRRVLPALHHLGVPVQRHLPRLDDRGR